MDISLSDQRNGIQIEPKSVHGILWLQTHFENEYWEAIASNQVKVPLKDAKALLIDAEDAGLSLNCLPALSIAKTL